MSLKACTTSASATFLMHTKSNLTSDDIKVIILLLSTFAKPKGSGANDMLTGHGTAALGTNNELLI